MAILNDQPFLNTSQRYFRVDIGRAHLTVPRLLSRGHCATSTRRGRSARRKNTSRSTVGGVRARLPQRRRQLVVFSPHYPSHANLGRKTNLWECYGTLAKVSKHNFRCWTPLTYSLSPKLYKNVVCGLENASQQGLRRLGLFEFCEKVRESDFRPDFRLTFFSSSCGRGCILAERTSF